MTLVEQIRAIIQSYGNGELEFSSFEKQFVHLYCYEKAGCYQFKGPERILLDQLKGLLSRCSEYEEDINAFPEMYDSVETFNISFRKLLIELKKIWSSKENDISLY